MNQSSSLISLRFGEFELVPQLRRLELNGVPVDLSSRAMDILCALAERPGEVVSKQELLARAWPGVTVGEGSVRFHVSALRRALRDREGGTRYIQTVSGRGYCFVGVDPRPSTTRSSLPLVRQPPPHGQVVGREETVRELLRLLEAERFVTVVGAGGIGKSTVALVAAHQWREMVQGEATFVDLGSLTQGSRDAVIVAVARALGTGRQTFDDLVKHLRRGRQPLVLDTCEAAIEEVAQAAEMFFVEVPEVGVDTCVFGMSSMSATKPRFRLARGAAGAIET
jgi:DNA-binding winged helix-turn-helix (wHTH) protein